jgi:hypothetical protein
MVEITIMVLMVHFQVRKGRIAPGAPIGDVVALVDETLAI